MDRNKAFDKILKYLYDNPDHFWNLIPTCKEHLGITDNRLIRSIAKEMVQRNWVMPKKNDETSVVIEYEGQQIVEKYGSYSRFIRKEKKQHKAKVWGTKLSNAKTIITIITTVGMFVLGVFKFMDNRKINNLEKEVKQLNSTIDSLETEIKNTPQQQLL